MDPLSKWMNHSQEIKGLVVGIAREWMKFQFQSGSQKNGQGKASTKCALSFYKEKTSRFLQLSVCSVIPAISPVRSAKISAT
jgi:hypothetical protein